MQIKRSRLDSSASVQPPVNITALIDPALLTDPGISAGSPGGTRDLTNVQAASAALNFMNVDDPMQVDSTPGVEPAAAETMVKSEPDHIDRSGVVDHPSIELSNGYAVPEHAVDDEPGPKLETTPHTSTSPVSQRHSSRQPKQVERFVPADHRSPSKVQQASVRRASSAVSAHTIVNSVKSRRSSSNTSATLMNGVHISTKNGMPSNGAERLGSQGRESTADSELTADERMARELQAEEHGLRRRQSMRV
jgi:hypothetical protein